MSKKVIGVYADTFNGKVGQTFAYMQFLSQFGSVRLITTTDNMREVAQNVDMLVIPGGADVDPARYDAVPGVMDSRVNAHYEYLDSVLIPLFISAKKPIVGICRGMQSLNVFFGGTLNQHIIGHHQGDNRAETKQEVQFEDGSSHKINTMHHQSVDVLGKGIEIVGYGLMYEGCYGNMSHARNWKSVNSKNVVSFQETYVVVEMIKHTDLPIIGFQWHPEEFNCKIAVQHINNLLNAYEKKASSINQ
jgi:gamma-glutamyl-gamma-aminobutyrate hydrolase PuuD